MKFLDALGLVPKLLLKLADSRLVLGKLEVFVGQQALGLLERSQLPSSPNNLLLKPSPPLLQPPIPPLHLPTRLLSPLLQPIQLLIPNQQPGIFIQLPIQVLRKASLLVQLSLHLLVEALQAG